MDRTQLLKGVLDLAVLAALKGEDGYGYDIVRRLRTVGITDVGDASVYGTLRRLFQAGALSSYLQPSEEGPHRKYYALTTSGVAQLADATKIWAEFTDTMARLLDNRNEAA